jgi:peptidoglycan/xylan/chitin deacetylase (PgdA/CDA1 family)
MQSGRKILLTLDVEEFDLPAEYGIEIPVEEQLSVGYKGLKALEPILTKKGNYFTLFTTAFFAENFPDDISRLSKDHEIGSHTYYHSRYEPHHLVESKEKLESITGQAVYGLRMPRLRIIDAKTISRAGYLYDSSINPTWIPGRYNNFSSARTFFKDNGLVRLPVSVTPYFRIPLFWLAFKNMPYNLFLKLVLRTLRRDQYISLYFHPWEFTDLTAYKIPGYIKRGSSQKLLDKFSTLVKDLSNEGDFARINEFVNPARSFT